MTFTKIGHANSTHVHFTFALNHNLNWVTSFMNTPISFKRFPCTFFIHQQTSLKLTKMHLFFSAFAFFIFLVGTRLGAHFIIMILIIQYKPRMNLVNKFEHYLKHQPLFKQSDLDSMFHTMFWLAAYIRSHFKSQLGQSNDNNHFSPKPWFEMRSPGTESRRANHWATPTARLRSYYFFC